MAERTITGLWLKYVSRKTSNLDPNFLKKCMADDLRNAKALGRKDGVLREIRGDQAWLGRYLTKNSAAMRQFYGRAKDGDE